MKIARLLRVAAAIGLSGMTVSAAQTKPPPRSSIELNGLALVKQKAEDGDAGAQVTLGNSLLSHSRPADALAWFEKAAAQKNVEGMYLSGNMLLFGAPASPADQAVRPNHLEGLRWTYMAATNLHTGACRNMARALRQGLGTSTNLLEAYAWLLLCQRSSSGSATAQNEMNDLALALDTSSLQQARQMAIRFNARDWPPLCERSAPETDTRFKLSGVTTGAASRLAIINGKTLAEGESAALVIKSEALNITCVKVEDDSVTIAIDGETGHRRLFFR